jgi:CMP-N,N'-diacetyllegionaminic acid synthase
MTAKPAAVVAIILARGGSKGLVRKNIRRLNGRPLIAYTIEAARRAATVDRVIVSTDDSEIAAVAQAEGAEVPFRRPRELAADNTTSEAALKHAVEWLRDQNGMPAIVVYLQITDPFRTPRMIDQCVRALQDDPSVDSAFLALETHKNYWRKTKDGWRRLADDIPYGVPRQLKEPLYREDTGLALATRASVIMQGRRLGDRCVVIPHHHPAAFVDIHEEADLHIAEFLIERLGIRPNESHESDV